MSTDRNNRKACVTGGSGYVASSLIKMLLEKGYSVNTTVRDPGNEKKLSHLNELKSLGELNVFRADLTNETSFDAPLEGCEFVFHVATPINFASTNPEKDVIEPAVQGVLNVLGACKRSKSVKRVVFTSSASAVCGNNLRETTGPMLITWFLRNHLPGLLIRYACDRFQGYSVSKTLAEKAAWRFAEENGIDLVTVAPPFLAGSSIIAEPGSLHVATSLVTGNELLMNGLKNMQIKSGFLGLTHVEDACRAHIFVDSAFGRYNCCEVNTSLPMFSKFLKKRYPHYSIQTEFIDMPSESKMIMSSEKLIREGFTFKYTLEDICDQSIQVLKENGTLQH